MKHDVKELTIHEAATRKTTEPLLDAREKKEYDLSHIRNGVYFGYYNFDLGLVNILVISGISAAPKVPQLMMDDSVIQRFPGRSPIR